MPARISEDIRIKQLNSFDGRTFVRWDCEYRNSLSKAVMRCSEGHEWSARVDNLVQGSGCPKCAGLYHYSASERIDQLNALDGVRFIRWDGEYLNAHSKAVMCCSEGHEWSSSISDLSQGSRCPKCSGVYRYSASERVTQLNAIEGCNFVRWDDGYRNQHSKAVMCCSEGHEWSASVNSLTRGHGCPHCSEHGYNPSKIGTLYALRSECGTMVKIGISNNYKTRHKQLEIATPFNWNIVELLHGDGALIRNLEVNFHNMTEQVRFDEPFHGYTEWRIWKPEITSWFTQWSDLINKETK